MQKDNETQPIASGSKIVETYAEDMAKVIENDKGGLVKKIIHGEEEHEAEKRNLSPESKKNKYFMLVSILLIFLALVTLSFFFFKKDINTIEPPLQFVPLIFNDKSNYIEIAGFNKDKIVQIVSNIVNGTEVKADGVEGIYLTEDKKVIGLRRFIELIEGSFMPGDIDLVNDNFLLGVVNNKNNETKDFFILLKVRTLSDIFDNLRAWENKMFLDLQGFFGVDISPETKHLLTAEFQNVIVENKNTRVLYDKEGLIVMMYVLADDNSVVITNNENTAREIMFRLSQGRIQK